LRVKGRANALSKAKALICHWGTQELGLTMRDIAEHLAITQPAVSNWVKKGKEYCDDQDLEFSVVEE
jgi:predicted transcriptional regulator